MRLDWLVGGGGQRRGGGRHCGLRKRGQQDSLCARFLCVLAPLARPGQDRGLSTRNRNGSVTCFCSPPTPQDPFNPNLKVPNPELGYPGGPFDPLGFSKVRACRSLPPAFCS